MKRALLIGGLLGCLLVLPAQAETAQVAVAANFTVVAEQLGALFEAETVHELRFSFGATGLLYSQIAQGAPFDVLLAADAERPARAVAEGFGIGGSVFTYANGVLALYSATLDVAVGAGVLEQAFGKLAIADPAAAPYGRAAVEALTALGLFQTLQSKLVMGENVGQTLQFVQTGNAELGFVALSQVMGQESVWIVPSELYAPIQQDAVLLKSGSTNAAAMAFLRFLRSDDALQLIERAGYQVDR